MTYEQAIVEIYRKVKEQGKPINILTLTRKMKNKYSFVDISDELIEAIVKKIVEAQHKRLNK